MNWTRVEHDANGISKDGNTRVLLVPHSPSAVDDVGKQVQQALLVTKE